jgi:DNA-directed RNA polymerase subunit RPC12/RpoP
MAKVRTLADQFNVSPWVPVESFRSIASPYPFPDYPNYLNSLCDEIDRHNENEERKRHEKWLTCENFYQDRQLGSFNHRGEFEPLQYEAADPVYVCNFLSYFIDTIAKEVVRSSARIQIKPIVDTVRRRAAARLYDAQIKEIQKRNWLASEKEREAKQLLLRGNSIRRVRAINDYNDIQLIPITKLVEKPLGRDTFGCTNPECAYIGNLEEAPDQQCPQCGAKVLVKPAPKIQAEEIEKYDAKPAKTADIDVVDTFAVKINLHSRGARESDYLRYRALIEPSVARYFYKWIAAGGGEHGDSGQRAQLELQRSAGNWNGSGTVDSHTTNHDLVDYAEYYLEPSRYCDYINPRDVELAGGQIFHAEETLLQHFPRGLKITRVGGVIADVQEAEKNREWVQVQWSQMNSTAWAWGAAERIIEPQRASNEMMSLFWEILLREAAGLTIVNQTKIDRSQMVYRPGYVGTMRQGGHVANDNPGNYIFAMPSGASRPDLMAGIESNKANFTLLTGGAFSTDGALPNQAGANTATGINTLREQSLANLAPRLAQIAEADVRTTEICCDLIKEHDLCAQYVRSHPEYHELEYDAAQECDPRTDFEISYAEGSYMPRLESERRSEFLAANAQGLYNLQLPAEYREQVAKAFNQPLFDQKGEAQVRDEEITLEKLEKLAQKAMASQVDEEQAAMEVRSAFPVRMEHDGMIRTGFLFNYLLTDVGRNANPYLRRFIYDRVNGFRQADVMRAQADQMQMMQANGPAIAAQGAASNRSSQTPAQNL